MNIGVQLELVWHPMENGGEIAEDFANKIVQIQSKL